MKAEILISLIFLERSSICAGQVNIAVGKPASQSSNLTYPGPRAVWIANNAVDGKKECQIFDHDHYSGTNNELVPWWQVDLQRIYHITDVIVYGPNITHHEQLQGFYVFISSSESNHQQSIYNNTDYGNGTFNIHVSVSSYIIGRYVRIEMPGTYRTPTGRAGSLVLCEVEVFSSDEKIIQLLTDSVKTSMSSVASNRTSDLAIDGNIGSDPDQCQCCSETANSQLSWWMVAFREYIPVKKVIVYSRNNDCKVGTYGSECSQRCHCGDNKPYDSVTGQCQSRACKTGWKGSACNKKCLPDTFGDDCREKCYCAVGTCTNNYGICTGKCRRGYHGPHSESVMYNQTDINVHRKNITTAEVGLAVGGSVVVLSLIATNGVIIYKCRKRDSNENNDKNDNNTITSIYITPTEPAQYDTIYTSNDSRESTNSGYTSVTGC